MTIGLTYLQRCVGDRFKMLVTESPPYVGDFFHYVSDFFSVLIWSPIHFVSNVRDVTTVTNIDVALFSRGLEQNPWQINSATCGAKIQNHSRHIQK